MINTPTLTIHGLSGNIYTFYTYKLPVSFDRKGGVYLFTKLLPNGAHKYIYLGITGDLSERFDEHHKAYCIRANGATHLSAFVLHSEQERKKVEKDIMAIISTTCNEQLN